MMTQRRLLWWLVAALIVAQTLGLLHRVAHPAAMQVIAATAGAGERGHSWVASLFSGHDDDASCRVYDQLSHADGMPTMAVIAPAIAAALFLLPFFQGDALARWAALFQARGPPIPR